MKTVLHKKEEIMLKEESVKLIERFKIQLKAALAQPECWVLSEKNRQERITHITSGIYYFPSHTFTANDVAVYAPDTTELGRFDRLVVRKGYLAHLKYVQDCEEKVKEEATVAFLKSFPGF